MENSEESSSSDEFSEEEDEEEYGDLHRVVLQGFMKSGYLAADEVKNLFSKIQRELNSE